jgi:CHASE2 domain-containing sensor protein
MKLLFKISAHWLGLFVMILCMGLSAIDFYPFEILERRFMDFAAGFHIKNNRYFQPSVIVDIDENSISKLGSWPLPRSYFSSLIQILSHAQAKTIAIDVLFEKKENDRIVREIQNIKDTFVTLIQDSSEHYSTFLNHINEKELQIDHDIQLINAIQQSGNVILPLIFKLNQLIPDLDQHLFAPKMVDPLDLPLPTQPVQLFSPFTASSVSMPFSEINTAVAGLGHINIQPDIDGKIRKHTLCVMYENKYYPSLPLRAIIHYLGLQQQDLEILPPNGLRAGNRYIETDESISIYIKPQLYEVPKYSFYDVLNGLVPDRVFKDRIVIVGGKSSLLNLPDNRLIPEKYSHPIYQSTVIENILSNTTIIRPEWSWYTELAIMFIFGIFIIFILPKNGVIAGIVFTMIFIGVWTTGCVVLLTTENMWLKWIYPCVELVLSMLIIIPRQLFTTEKIASPILQTMIQRHPYTHKTLDQYEVEEELGRGMLGVVYRANDKENERWVAIKTIQINTGRTSEKLENAKQQFIKEAQAACRLKHPGIVELYDVGIENDICYIVMEYLDSNALDTHFTRKTLLPLRKVLHYIIQICDALSYSHQKWIIHGGIKPSNIFLNRKDMIKVSDFGIDPFAKEIGSQTGEMLITPGYMSPEQVEGKKIDGRSDLFSLGIVLYHLITGELPFQGASLSELMYNISHQNPVSPKSINPKIPTALELILIKALSKEPNERFQSADSFGRHLRILDEKIQIAVNKKRNIKRI